MLRDDRKRMASLQQLVLPKWAWISCTQPSVHTYVKHTYVHTGLMWTCAQSTYIRTYVRMYILGACEYYILHGLLQSNTALHKQLVLTSFIFSPVVELTVEGNAVCGGTLLIAVSITSAVL